MKPEKENAHEKKTAKKSPSQLLLFYFFCAKML